MKKSILIVFLIMIAFNGCGPKLAINKFVKNNDIEGIKRELSNGVNPNTAIDMNMASLQTAVWYDSFDALKYLVENGADINVTTKHYLSTPLIVAVYNEEIEIINYLIKNGANPHLRNINKDTASFYTTNDKILQILKNAEINYESNLKKIKEKKKQEELALFKKEEQRTQKKHQSKVELYLNKKDFVGLKKYTDTYPSSAYYIQNNRLRIMLIGPSGMKVGDIVKLTQKGKSERIIISLINISESPYKKFTLEEIDLLSSMNLSDSVIASMIDVTNILLKDERRKKEQDFFLSEQKRIASEIKNNNSKNQKIDQYGNPIIDKVENEVSKQGIKMLFDYLF